MKLNRVNSSIDRNERNKINDNFDIIERGFGKTALDAQYAIETSDEAKLKAESTQIQLNTIVIEGDSSVEAAQARVSADDTIYTTLKERLDNENVQVTKQLTQLAVDITTFGALGDYDENTGVGTDNSFAFTSALDYARANKINKILIPPGKYRIVSPLLIDIIVSLEGADTDLATQLIFDNDDEEAKFIMITSARTKLKNLNIKTKNPAMAAVFRKDTSYSEDYNLLIEGQFRRGWWHQHNGVGGYYNQNKKIRVIAPAEPYFNDTIGIYCEGYYSASTFERCDVTRANIGFKFDYANAVKLINPCPENSKDSGIYIGTQTSGLSIDAPYFEGNLKFRNVVCEEGAENIDLNYMRGTHPLNEMFTHNNQIRIDGGLRSLTHHWGVKNLIANGQGKYTLPNGKLVGVVENYATSSKETVNTNGLPTAIRATAQSGRARGDIRFALDNSANEGDGYITVTFDYYLEPESTNDARVYLYNQATILSGTVLDKRGVWTKAVFRAKVSTSDKSLRIYIIPEFATSVGGEYVLINNLQVNFGDYFSPVYQDDTNKILYHESGSVATSETIYPNVKKFCGFTALSSGTSTKTINLPSDFIITKVLNVQCSNATSFIPIKVDATTTAITFSTEAAVTAATKVWFEIVGY